MDRSPVISESKGRQPSQSRRFFQALSVSGRAVSFGEVGAIQGYGYVHFFRVDEDMLGMDVNTALSAWVC